MKVYRGSAVAARTYVEADRARGDDYYLAEGTGLADRYIATPDSTLATGSLDGDAYQGWVAGFDTNGVKKGRLRTGPKGVRFVEVTVNGPKTWSLAAAVHPEIAAAYDAAQQRAAGEIIGWVAAHATTRVGPQGRQVQVPVEEIEAAVIRHHTSRAGDPHRHLHLQVNARVRAVKKWRALHTVGVRDSLAAINGIGHAAIACDPVFRRVLAEHGYHLHPDTAEVVELAPFAGKFSARAAQINRNLEAYETAWRTTHPGQEPGRRLRRAWDIRAWTHARPDKVVPVDGSSLRTRWVEELFELGFQPPTGPVEVTGLLPGRVDRDLVVQVVLSRLGAARSAWNSADIRGEVEQILVIAGVIAEPAARIELAEDLVERARAACTPLLRRADAPAHVRTLTSPEVLAVEADLIDRLTRRIQQGVAPLTPADAPRTEKPAARPGRTYPAVAVRAWAARTGVGLDRAQVGVVALLAGDAPLVVVEGAAGAGKTTVLTAVHAALETQQQRLVVVTPTRKAARVATAQVGAPASSAAWLAYQHGFRWNSDGHWTRISVHKRPTSPTATAAQLSPGDLLLVDEAGMLDQDTARALLVIADETGARIALVGDRHQLPAVGRGGVLDLAARWAPPQMCRMLDTVHRFADPTYAALTLQMRTGQDPEAVFDQLHAAGRIAVYPSDTDRHHAVVTLTTHDTDAPRTGLRVALMADSREQVTALNAAVRDHRHTTAPPNATVVTGVGEQIGVGDQIVTRRNDPDLDVANRDTWRVTAIRPDGSLTITPLTNHARPTTLISTSNPVRPAPSTGPGERNGEQSGERRLPADYVSRYVELGYATTIYGAQGDTVDTAHLLIGDTTGAASAYVGMTRGRHANTAHLVADTVEDAREQWVRVFGRDRADLGPGHAAQTAADDIDRYGPAATPTRSSASAGLQAAALRQPRHQLVLDPDRSVTVRRRHSVHQPARARVDDARLLTAKSSRRKQLVLPCPIRRRDGCL